MTKTIHWICFILFATFASTTTADTVTIDASADTTIYSNQVNNNGGGNAFTISGIANNGASRRMLLNFDLTGVAPGSVITSASLNVTVNQASSGGGNFQLFQVDTDWVEGNKTGNQGSIASNGEATWNEAQRNVLDWTDGGSFLAPLLNQTSITAVGTSNFATSTNFVSAAQSMVDTPANNFGFIVIGTDASSALRFDTRDSGQVAQLTLEFTAIPEPTSGLVLGLGCLFVAIRRRRV